MRHGRLHRADDQSCLVPMASRTSNVLERMRGLLGRPQLNEDEGLIINPCSSIHTAGMRYPIDLVFLDRNWIIIKTVTALKPWRMAACPAASMVLELPTGSGGRLRLETGLQLVWHGE